MGNPFLGVFLHWLGGLASGSFYVPYKGVKKWSWETYWLVGGFFSWIICPVFFASILTSNLGAVLGEQTSSTLWWTYFFGVLWGFGGLTFGLTMRYLGMSLGMGVALGYCAAFGTLVPPIFKQFMPSLPVGASIREIANSTAGQVTLAGVAVCLLGIGIAALAGFTKEREMPEEQKKRAIKEFNFKKGILVATFSGIMSACFAFGLTAANPIKTSTLKYDYLREARQQGVAVSDASPLSEAAIAGFLDRIKATKFFQNASPEIQANPSIENVLEQIEAPSSLTTAQEQAQVLSQSADPVGVRLATYSSNLAKLAGKTNELAVIRGLRYLDIKEVAAAIAASGGDLVKYNSKHELWQGLPALIVILLGGFTTNFIWCVLLNLKNKTGYQYLASQVRVEHCDHGGSGGGEHGPSPSAKSKTASLDLKIPKMSNYLFSALAGTTWYFQFFFYQMGTTQMGKYDFASWTLHMASIIIFSTMWGWIFHEWKGSSKKAHLLIAGGIGTLILSTAVIGLGAAMNGGRSFHDIVKVLFG